MVIIGEIGGNIEEVTAEYIARRYPKPVVAFIARRSAPHETCIGMLAR